MFTKILSGVRFSEINDMKYCKNVIISNKRSEKAFIFDSKSKQFYGTTNLTHTMVVGGTGCGKTSCIIIPQLLAYIESENSFISIGAPDVMVRTCSVAEKKGYELYKIDFNNLESSNKINVLQLLLDHYDENDLASSHRAAKNIEQLSKIMYERGDDPFWKDSSVETLQGAIMLLNKIAKKEQVSLLNAYRLITEGFERGKPIENVLNYLRDTEGVEFEQLKTIRVAPSETLGSIISVFSSKLSFFGMSELVKNIFSSINDIPIHEIRKKKMGIYITLPYEDKEQAYIISIILFAFLKVISLNTDLFDRPEKRPILFSCDEFPLYMFTEMETYLANSRKYGISWTIAMQSISQLEKLDKVFANVVQENCTCKITMKTSNKDTIATICESYGNREIIYDTEILRIPLIKPNDIKGLPVFESFIELDEFYLFQKLTPYFLFNDYMMLLPSKNERSNLYRKEESSYQTFSIKKYNSNLVEKAFFNRITDKPGV